ncbi:acetyl-CoA carboxylase biotin carboxylase subunit family protein [Streptomyces sp. NPDC048723]|uniref:ATP-grasp domain-containing protein n=1 Tax=Streptomyces sp. NPDC048723 TaxID=3365589 RepID=UPI0037172027
MRPHESHSERGEPVSHTALIGPYGAAAPAGTDSSPSPAPPRVGVVLSPRGAATVRDLLVAAGPDVRIVPLLRREVSAQWPGLTTLATRLFGEVFEVDAADPVVPGPPLAGVVTFGDAELELAAAIGRRLAVRHRDASPADKYVQRSTLAEAGLTRMGALPLSGPADLDTACDLLGLPFVVKPRRGAGGEDVTVVRTEERLRALQEFWPSDAYRFAEGFIHDASAQAGDWRADYVSVEVQSVAGRHDVITVFGKFPVYTRAGTVGQVSTTGDILPDGLGEETRRRVTALVLKAHEALGIGDGVSHTEVKLGADGPEIIEINCRVGGHLSRLLRRRSGFDMVRQALLITAGLPPQPLPEAGGERAVAGMFVPLATLDGTIASKVSPADLHAVGAVAVDEVARAGAARADSDGIACNVVLDHADLSELRYGAADFLDRVRTLFAADGVGQGDWTETMIARLTADPALAACTDAAAPASASVEAGV